MSEVQRTVEEITLDDVLNPARLDRIWQARAEFYWTCDWSPEFYVALARAGFISVAHEFGAVHVLLPQLQAAYAVLDWVDLHVSLSTRRWLRSRVCREQEYRLSIGHDLSAVLAGIQACHGELNWMTGRYLRLLTELRAGGWGGFELIPVGLVNADNVLVAGEIGYLCGGVYTSLTGFSDRSHNHAGKLQLLKLGEYLQASNLDFWNLGHPYMRYKLDLGAKICRRKEFLERWRKVVGR